MKKHIKVYKKKTSKKTNKKVIKLKSIDDKISKEETERILSSSEYKIIKQLESKGLNAKQILKYLETLNTGEPLTDKVYSLGEANTRILVFGDTHIGNKMYDPALMTYAAEMAKKEKVDMILHTGDIVDGWYQNRPASIFEQNAIGFDEQLDMAVEEFTKLKTVHKPIYFITGNHEYNTYMRGAGVELGRTFEEKLNSLGMETKYLGNGEATIKLDSGTTIKMVHPDGGTAYAISYKSQKLIESIDGGKKPNIILMGHFHKAEYLFYRNVHMIQTATLCGQTKFMRANSLAAMKGFYILDIKSKKGGQVDSITPTFYPAYD
jgi:predicted phosphodiesterase